MLKLLLSIIVLSTTLLFADTWVDGYFRTDGTYVQGHYRKDANSTSSDNYSTKGNTNIYTGSEGTKKDNDSYTTSSSQVWVNGYYRKDGTYVSGHYRSK